jgi:hypothetical protein
VRAEKESNLMMAIKAWSSINHSTPYCLLPMMLREFSKLLSCKRPKTYHANASSHWTNCLYFGVLSSVHCLVIQTAVSTFGLTSRSFMDRETSTISIPTAIDWIGLDWIGLDWIGLDWIGLDWIGLDWILFDVSFLLVCLGVS